MWSHKFSILRLKVFKIGMCFCVSGVASGWTALYLHLFGSRRLPVWLLQTQQKKIL
jgi:hypothetical protein